MQVWDVLGDEGAWRRGNPPVGRRDVAVVAAVGLLLAISLELLRSFADFAGARPVWVEYLALAASTLLLLGRRRWPLPTLLTSFAVFFATLTWVPEVGYQFFYQLVFFVALYSAVAWAGDRRVLTVTVAGVVLAFMVWVAWDLATSSAIDDYLRRAEGWTSPGLFPRATAYALFMVVSNLVYLVGAVALGQVAWRQAHDAALLAESAATIQRQADDLRNQAVVDERLRIARELHDVVAHHVSVMGIQAAGARRALGTRPDLAETALERVEESARQAVAQLRGLLGALRSLDDGPAEADRGPQPTLAQLDALLAESADRGVTATLTRVEQVPGELDALPLPLQLSLYRTVQEALTNVARHSTARAASVALRVLTLSGGGRAVEVEVLDDGRPRGGTSGSGLGLLGMRERIASHGGTSEIGPRPTGGYRVRVRFPLESTR